MSKAATGQRSGVDSALVRRTMRGYVLALVAISLTLGVLHVVYQDINLGGTRWFDLDKERNLATWFSGTLFFLFGVAAILAFALESRRNGEAGTATFRLPVLWLGVAALGCWMSLDEITILHENLLWREVRIASNERSDAWKYLTQWQVLFGPAILVALSYMVVFFTNRFAASPAARRGAFGGLGCWTLALLLEAVRGTVRQVGSTWYEFSVVVEESLEMLGAVFLLTAIVGYVLDIAFDFTAERRRQLALGGVFLSRRALVGLATTFVVLSLGAGLAWSMARRQAAAGDPVPGLFRRAVAEAPAPERKRELRPAELPPSTPPSVWFEDLGARPLPDVDDATWGEWLASLFYDGDAPAAAGALTRDKAPRIAFLAVSDGGRARVYRGLGKGIADAVRSARGASGLAAADLSTRWVRLDVVDTVEDEDRIDLRPPLAMERGIHGMAFSRRAGIALSPAELAANSLIDFDRAIRPRAMLGFLQATDPPSAERFTQMLQPRVVNPYRFFTTRAFFFDAGKPLPLYRGHRLFTSLTPAGLLDSARMAGDYLVESVLADGRFIYSYTPSIDVIADDYNMLRHAGTIYSMAELYEVTKDERVIGAARRALEFLEDRIKPCTSSLEGTSCVIDGASVKLGGNALAVIAIAKYTVVTGDSEFRHLLEPLVRWIQSVQDVSGEFTVHKQSFPGGQDSGFVSGYYPGEAILALCRAYDLLGDESLLDTAEAAALWLIEVRDEGVPVPELNHDHWLLYALNEVYRHRRAPEFLDHSRRIAQAIVEKQNREPEFPDWLGSYYKPPRSTPTAIRTEGLSATWALLRDFGRPGENEPILEAMRLGIRFELQTQHRPEQVMFYANPLRTLGAFQRSLSEDEIRIDYVQHNISALLALRQILLDEAR